MKINNTENIPLVESFITKFGRKIVTVFQEEVKQFPPCVNIIGEEKMCCGTLLINAIVSDIGYFGVNGDTIGYRVSKVNELNLKDEEIFAMLAHEFGHIYHWYTDYCSDGNINFLQKEIDADKMACRLGLKVSLISGLTILKENGICEGGTVQIQQRIDELNKCIL